MGGGRSGLSSSEGVAPDSARPGRLEAGRSLPQKLPALPPRPVDGSGAPLTSARSETAEDALAAEGQIKSMPRLARSRPSDRAARRKALEGRLRAAHEKVAAEAALPLVHGRCCIMGLAVLGLIRVAAWWQGTIPGYSVFGMHFLTTTSDIACILCAFPLFATGTKGQCVQFGCLGPMLTLVFAMSLVDISALGAYLVVATPRPLSPGAKSYVDALEACVGVWEFALVASVALQMALCASCWRVYRELRMNGLYPPGVDPAGVGKLREISIMEVMCEAEDVELLADCEVNCEDSLKNPLMVETIPAMPGTPSLAPAKAQEIAFASHAKVVEGAVDVDEALLGDSQSVTAVKCQMRPPVASGARPATTPPRQEAACSAKAVTPGQEARESEPSGAAGTHAAFTTAPPRPSGHAAHSLAGDSAGGPELAAAPPEAADTGDCAV